MAVGDPITRCKEEEGVEDKDIIVDIILCLQYANTIPTWTKDDMMWSNALDFYRRRERISDFYVDYEDMLRVTRAHPDITYRYTVAPSRTPPISGFIPISASKE